MNLTIKKRYKIKIKLSSALAFFLLHCKLEKRIGRKDQTLGRKIWILEWFGIRFGKVEYRIPRLDIRPSRVLNTSLCVKLTKWNRFHPNIEVKKIKFKQLFKVIVGKQTSGETVEKTDQETESITKRSAAVAFEQQCLWPTIKFVKNKKFWSSIWGCYKVRTGMPLQWFTQIA